VIGALILGLVAGAIAKLIMPGDDPGGIFVTIILGLVGAFVGYLIFTRLLGIGDNEAFDLGGLIGAVIGAMILLGIYRAVAKPEGRTFGRAPRSCCGGARDFCSCGVADIGSVDTRAIGFSIDAGGVRGEVYARKKESVGAVLRDHKSIV